MIHGPPGDTQTARRYMDLLRDTRTSREILGRPGRYSDRLGDTRTAREILRQPGRYSDSPGDTRTGRVLQNVITVTLSSNMFHQNNMFWFVGFNESGGNHRHHVTRVTAWCVICQIIHLPLSWKITVLMIHVVIGGFFAPCKDHLCMWKMSTSS